MGAIRIGHLSWRLPGGAELFDDVSFTVGDGERVALVGANGVGKTTLLDLIADDRTATTGTIAVDGRLGVLRQLAFRRQSDEAWTVRDLLVSLAAPPLQRAATRLRDAEACLDDDPMGYAHAIAEWGDAGGFDAEVHWDECCTRAVGLPLADVAARPVGTFSGGEQKRLALEVLLRGEADVLLLDEPDNFLDVEAKRWLEGELTSTRKTVLYVSHDRELLAATATKIVTIEAHGAWTHGGSFTTYAEARRAHLDKLAHDRSLYDNERERLEALVAEMRRRASFSEVFAPKLKAAESRLRLFVEKNERPVDVREQRITMRLGGARTGRRALVVEQLELGPAEPGSSRLTDPFDLDVDFGDRVAVLGGNGAGKSHFLRLLGGDGSVEHHGRFCLGAGVVLGLFHQTHEHPEWTGRTLIEILHRHDVVRGPAMAMLRRYEIQRCADQPFETLSGGQQARFQILLLETMGATMLLLDEPTDNLDLVSAEALEAGLAEFTGTVVAVTHDRWFLRGFDRFVVFGADCTVRDHLTIPAGWATA